MKMNKEWHAQNKMPKNPTFEQRIQWHVAHEKNCNCRPIPKKLAEDIKKLLGNDKSSRFLLL